MLKRGKSCGCFLEPPNHPSYSYAWETIDEYASVDTVAKNEHGYFPEKAVWLANKFLDDYDINEQSPELVQDWIHKVLGYFKNCYSKDGVTRDVNDGLIVAKQGEKYPLDHHLGVMHVRQYLPDWTPTKDDFIHAYWGTKPGSEVEDVDDGDV